MNVVVVRHTEEKVEVGGQRRWARPDGACGTIVPRESDAYAVAGAVWRLTRATSLREFPKKVEVVNWPAVEVITCCTEEPHVNSTRTVLWEVPLAIGASTR